MRSIAEKHRRIAAPVGTAGLPSDAEGQKKAGKAGRALGFVLGQLKSRIVLVIAIVAAAVVCFVINTVTVSSAIAIQLLNFGFINGLIVMGIALAVAFIGTILPVYFAARKVPVESIRAL